jgi:hypothetical protein
VQLLYAAFGLLLLVHIEARWRRAPPPA